MNLASIKNSDLPKRRLYQIERAIVREITDLWCKDKSFYDRNFAEDVEVDLTGNRIAISFANTGRMQHGVPEATVNEMMRGLVLTMAADQQGKLLQNHEIIIKNILDVFFHRLLEIADKKFIYQRLQSLELGFGITFGLGAEFFPIRRERRVLEEILTIVSLSGAKETAETLINDMLEADRLAPREHGVTFHIFMGSETEASFLSLPLGTEQANYISLLGTHTLRCNILAEVGNDRNIKAGILKIDAPQKPLNFIRHKNLELSLAENQLMDKLRSSKPLTPADFSRDELLFVKVLFNEYVELAHFLLSSGRISPGMRLLIIFPRVNIFTLMHAENPAIPAEEPQTLGELAALSACRFSVSKAAGRRKQKKRHHVPEKIIQEHVLQATQAFARSIIKNIYKPVTDIRRGCVYLAQKQFKDAELTGTLRQRVDSISAYLRRLKQMQRVVIDPKTNILDLEASCMSSEHEQPFDVLSEIVSSIQHSELDQMKEIVVAKMIEYLSFVTVRLEQVARVSSPFIKEEIIRDIEHYSASVLNQAKSFYKLMMGRGHRGGRH